MSLTRLEKSKQQDKISQKYISVRSSFDELEKELTKGDAEMRLLCKFLKERIETHNRKLNSASTRLRNKGTID